MNARRVLITSGGTRVPIDDVRHIANMSSGTFGRKIALELLSRGHSVDFLYAKGSKKPSSFEFNFNAPVNVSKLQAEYDSYKNRLQEIEYDSFSSYQLLVDELTINEYEYDYIILAAAVSDYTVIPKEGKASHDVIQLIPTEKIIESLFMKVSAKIIGFKLLSNASNSELIDKARKVLESADYVVANDLSDIKNGQHSVFILNDNEIVFHPRDAHIAVANLVKW